MGCSFSCKRFSSSSSKLKSIKIVHLNGYIEHLEHPVTVSEVIGKSADHFLFGHAQLLCSYSTPLKLDELLELGRVYFMLPYSLFESNASPLDLAPILRRLAAMGKNKWSKSGSKRKDLSSSVAGWSSGACTDPDRLSLDQSSGCDRSEQDQYFWHGMMRQKSSWKPDLDTIGEASFTLRSESDLSR